VTLTSYVCDKCGATVPPGGYPFCKGGHGVPMQHRPFVPYVDEHIQETPVLVTSHYHRKQLMKRAKCDFKGKRVGDPGCEI
jgi:hypothetical protein